MVLQLLYLMWHDIIFILLAFGSIATSLEHGHIETIVALFLVTHVSFMMLLALLREVNVDALVQVAHQTNNEVLVVGRDPRQHNLSVFHIFGRLALCVDLYQLELLIDRDVPFTLLVILPSVLHLLDCFGDSHVVDLQEQLLIISELMHELVVELHLWPHFDANAHDFDVCEVAFDDGLVEDVRPDVPPSREDFVVVSEESKEDVRLQERNVHDAVKAYLPNIICLFSIVNGLEYLRGLVPIVVVAKELDSVEPPLSQVRIGDSHDDSSLIHNEWILLLDPWRGALVEA